MLAFLHASASNLRALHLGFIRLFTVYASIQLSSVWLEYNVKVYVMNDTLQGSERKEMTEGKGRKKT